MADSGDAAPSAPFEPRLDDDAPTRLGPLQRHRLLDAVLALTADLDLRVTLRHITEVAVELVGATYGALGVLDPERTHLSDFVTVGVDDATSEAIGQLPRGRGILGRLIREPEPLRLRDLTADAESIGFPPNHPPMRSFLGVPLYIDGGVYGNLYLTNKRDGDEFSEDDEEMVVGLAAVAAVAIANARLQIRAREVELLEDRERIARDLHDTVIQRLFATGLSLQGVVRLAGREEVAQRIEATIDELDLTVREIRESIFELQASGEADVRSLRRELLEVGEELHDALDTVPSFEFDGPIDTEIADDLHADVLAVVREALTNIARHADATKADISVVLDEETLTITATDDGQGPGPLRSNGRGLGNMATRAETRGGRFEIGPNKPTGTTLVWQVPLEG